MSELAEARRNDCTCAWLSGFNVDSQHPHVWSEQVFQADGACRFHAKVEIILRFERTEFEAFRGVAERMGLTLVESLEQVARRYFADKMGE